MRKSLIFLIIAILLLCPIALWASDVTFSWDANTEPDLAGYRLYQAPKSGDYVGATPTDIPLSALADPSNPEYTKINLNDGTYFWVLTAYDTEGLESDYSNEVTTIIDTQVPSAPTGFTIDVVIGK